MVPARSITLVVATQILIGILLLVGAATQLSAQRFEDLQLAYNASFGNGSLDGSVDKLGIGSLKVGHAQVPLSYPTWTPQSGTYLLGITRPADYPASSGPVAAGLFATPVNFATGSAVGLRATFIAPIGPHATGNIWAAAVVARTGDEDDLFAETRVVASLTVRANGARLNVVGATIPPNLPNIPQEFYDSIFDPADPAPFTLELYVDRVTGHSEARLIVDERVFSVSFESAGFRAGSGSPITAVGPTIAMANGPGERATVRVRDFQIFVHKQLGKENRRAAECPSGWAEFGCRAP